MSDSSISIVPKRSDYPGNKKKAKEILNWLVSLDVVSAKLSDCVLGDDGGYSISKGALTVTDDPKSLPFVLSANGLEIKLERQVFDTGRNDIEALYCPSCNKDILDHGLDFIDRWYEENEDDVTCPLCNTTNEIHAFRFVPEMGFSNLGFTFWNWPEFSKEFIDEFGQRLGCEVSVVHQLI